MTAALNAPVTLVVGTTFVTRIAIRQQNRNNKLSSAATIEREGH
jgi:hypothetical protein